MPTPAAFEHRTHRSLANGERTALGKNSYIDSVLSYITKLALCSEELLVGGRNICVQKNEGEGNIVLSQK